MLSVILPAYDEEDAVADVARQAFAASPALAAIPGVGAVEIIVVDDGSRDRTAERAREVEGVHVVSLPRNAGYGGALMAGIEAARGNLLCFCDADGTCSPAAFEPLVRTLLGNGADMVIGSRLGADSSMPPLRRVGNRGFAALLSMLSLRRVSDTTSGMRVLTRAAYERLCPLPPDMRFTPAMSARALLSGRFRIHEHAVPYGERQGTSKMRVIQDGLLILTTYFGTAVRYRPLRVLGAAGTILLTAASAVAVARPASGPLAMGVAAFGATLVVAGVLTQRRATRLCAGS